MKRVFGWHLTNSKNLQYTDGRKIIIGRKLTVKGDIEPCKRGLHASPTILDALDYAASPRYLWRVTLSGQIVPSGRPIDKWAASERTALWCISGVDLDALWHRFARWCAADMAHAWPSQMRHRSIAKYLVTGQRSYWQDAHDMTRKTIFLPLEYAIADYLTAKQSAAETARVAAGSCTPRSARRVRARQRAVLDSWAKRLHDGWEMPAQLAWSEITPKSRAVLKKVWGDK